MINLRTKFTPVTLLKAIGGATKLHSPLGVLKIGIASAMFTFLSEDIVTDYMTKSHDKSKGSGTSSMVDNYVAEFTQLNAERL